MNKKPKKPNLFDVDDEFDKMYAEMQTQIAEIDGVPAPPVVRDRSLRDVMRPGLPPSTDKNFYWDRTKVYPTAIGIADIEEFLINLEHHANKFVWNHLTEGNYLRAWDKEGYTYDPLTAVVRAVRTFHFSICLSDLAASCLGLSVQDSQKVATVCWNPEQLLLEKAGLLELRKSIVEAIERGLRKTVNT